MQIQCKTTTSSAGMISDIAPLNFLIRLSLKIVFIRFLKHLIVHPRPTHTVRKGENREYL